MAGFHLVVSGTDPRVLREALHAWVDSFDPDDDVCLSVLGGVPGTALAALPRREGIPRVSLLEGPPPPLDLPDLLRSADAVIGTALEVRLARDLGVPALEWPPPASLVDLRAALRRPASPSPPLAGWFRHRWIATTPALEAAFRHVVRPEDSATLALDPETATAWLDDGDPQARALAASLGVPLVAATPEAMRAALDSVAGRCSVVMVTYNSMPTLPRCVESVLATLAPGDELIVVDNASTDGTADLLARLWDPRIRVLAGAENRGFAAATNAGLREASGEYLVLLNPDTVVTPGWLHRLREACADEAVGAAGPTSDRVAGLQKVQLHVKGALPSSPEGVAMLLGARNAAATVETRLLIGFCLMVPRRVLDRVGLLDEDLFLGNDDLDLSWRLRREGWKLVVATGAFVHHVGQVSFDSLPREAARRLVQESTDALARKLVAHYGRGRVPSPRELWGVDWFRPTVSLD